MSRPIDDATRAAIARCKGAMPLRACASAFGVSTNTVQRVWGRATRGPVRWRCGCGAIATGDVCGCGAPSAWVAADRRIAQEIAALGEVVE